MDELYVIWSHEHKQWWSPNKQGYVDNLKDAGKYTRDEAIELTFDNIPYGEEIAIPANHADRAYPNYIWGLKNVRSNP